MANQEREIKAWVVPFFILFLLNIQNKWNLLLKKLIHITPEQISKFLWVVYRERIPIIKLTVQMELQDKDTNPYFPPLTYSMPSTTEQRHIAAHEWAR